MHDAGRIRLGLVALGAYGVLVAVLIVARGPFVDPSEDPEAFLQVAGSTAFFAYSLGTALAVFLGIFGFLALYALLAERGAGVAGPAFRGLILSLGLVLLLPVLGVYAFAGPPLAGLYRHDPKHALELARSLATGWYLGTVVLQALLYCAGSAFFGIAIWRSGVLPRWTGAFLLLQGPMIQFVPLVSFAGEILGGALLATSCVAIAWLGARAGS